MLLGVIPARAGSKGIKDKNIYPLCGKPLIQYTVEAAKKSNINDIIITTDSQKIFDMHLCKTIIRDDELAKDDTPMYPVIKDAVEKYETITGAKVDAVMLLQPTSPLRRYEDINKAIKDFESNNKLSLYSGYYMGIKQKHKVYDKHKEEPHFQRNGAIFISKRCLLDSGKIWSNDAIEFEMPEERSVDIDNTSHILIAESLIKNGVLR